MVREIHWIRSIEMGGVNYVYMAHLVNKCLHTMYNADLYLNFIPFWTFFFTIWTTFVDDTVAWTSNCQRQCPSAPPGLVTAELYKRSENSTSGLGSENLHLLNGLFVYLSIIFKLKYNYIISSFPLSNPIYSLHYVCSCGFHISQKMLEPLEL